MDIMDSALAREIEEITANAQNVTYYWTAEFHANGQDYPAFKVLSIDIAQDFELAYSDNIFVALAIGGGAYTYRLVPYLSNLEVTLYKTPLSEVAGTVDNNRAIASQRYIAKILDARDPTMEANGQNQPDEFALDLTNMLTINLQLISKPMEQMRMRSVGGTYRKTTVEDVIRTVLTTESSNVEVTEQAAAGVEMIPATNKTVREHIVIPQGIKLVDMPAYVHAKCGGVYGTGFAYYYQAPYWYVFPPYNSSNFHERQKTLTVVRIPSNRMPGIERTFRMNGNNLTILATGELKTKSTGEELALNKGNGVRFADANKMMGGFVEIKDNTALASRGSTNSEVVSSQRANGNNNVLISEQRISSNPLVEYSKLAAREGDLIALSWENSYPDLIFPGMPVKIQYLDKDEIVEIYGLVIKAHHYVKTVGPGFASSRHLSTSNLTIFSKRLDSEASDVVS